MKIYRKGSFWFTALILVIVLTFVFLSLGYKADARLVPLLIGLSASGLAILILLSERYPRLIALFDVSLDRVAGVARSAPTSDRIEGEGKKVYLFLCNEVKGLDDFNFIDCWVNSACPRISDDFEGMVNIRDL